MGDVFLSGCFFAPHHAPQVFVSLLFAITLFSRTGRHFTSVSIKTIGINRIFILNLPLPVFFT
ncbi:hypothetical protein X474_04320 [Dethiosulfatarculus sandiegensis]|uniref:Uncharacterized protein n=1 Tax=Dethiosulfatarculus sandiegensis TaxID=1429043 RepID=A0A0D2GLD5_9BACT|nr:hypothetical protein X474_04320 [Dethiosulfatarculus sandiegensis]